jgi:shikimate kinase
LPPSRIALVGFSGTGKSLIGRILARKLGWAIIDTDHEIERLEGQTVPQIFGTRGEPEFRAIESRVLHDACARGAAVISTGGGAILSRENRQTLARCLVVALNSSAETIHERLARNPFSLAQRPLLQAKDPLQKIRETLEYRRPYYDLADLRIDTEGKTPEVSADEIRDGWLQTSEALLTDPKRVERLTGAPDASEAEAPYTHHHRGAPGGS